MIPPVVHPTSRNYAVNRELAETISRIAREHAELAADQESAPEFRYVAGDLRLLAEQADRWADRLSAADAPTWIVVEESSLSSVQVNHLRTALRWWSSFGGR